MRTLSVTSEVRWVVRVGQDGHAWHDISLVAYNLGTRNRAEVSALSVGLPRGVQFDSIRGHINGVRLNQADLYVPETHMIALDLERYVQTGSTEPARISFSFRQLYAVQQSGARRHVSFTGFSPTGLHASVIDHRVSLPQYRGVRKVIALLLAAVKRRSAHAPEGHGLALADVQPQSQDSCAFCPPPVQGFWNHRLDYRWIGFDQLSGRVLVLLLTFLFTIVAGIIAIVIVNIV
jgi:hypothetical protein